MNDSDAVTWNQVMILALFAFFSWAIVHVSKRITAIEDAAKEKAEAV